MLLFGLQFRLQAIGLEARQGVLQVRTPQGTFSVEAQRVGARLVHVA